ncbi:hypothetical protein [Methylobacterium sp. WCS2018Hpa-22]|uniref:hypothetical protein n=1 Tax=Methylobacterium sp. WCS2018Hpa-22 TaxID=3073633 RepID=UPI002889DFED|nr:hypothetical protein [Methylobacterium sp. WCS2018Hpa-22]
MPKSGWRYVFAFGGVGVLAGIFLTAALLTSSSPPNWESGAKQSKADQTEQKSRATVAGPIESTEQRDGSEEKWPCKRGQENRNSDLCAQWKAADSASDAALWGFLSFIVGIFGTIGLLINIIYTHRAVSVADKSVVESRRMGEVQNRAYLQIISKSSKIVFDKDSGCISPQVEVVVKNTGQTPAREVKIVAVHSKVWKGSTSFPKADVINYPGTNILEIGSQTEGKLVISPLGYGATTEWISKQISRSPHAGIIMNGAIFGYITFDDVFSINRTIRFRFQSLIFFGQDGNLQSSPVEFRFWMLPDEEAKSANRWKRNKDGGWTLQEA